ncbi:hypothetical protein PR048_009472 [Dryococelus australis]|uniref:PiggyBac transposable element-derived protein domain-containing protein n=1 Tax=Dryococelus australis TaxID=614101 RepID=A0ABQ9HZZ2_9NEOP|nr:hypothetical protein PR048_009472 [Dryococelus australis]
MPLKKYQLLQKYLYFADNTKVDDDRYFKVRPVLDIVRANCISVKNERRQAVDEMMVPHKGTRAANRKQYTKSKPKKWGFKIFVRAGASGFVYDFLVYGGSDTFYQYTFQQKKNLVSVVNSS